MVLRAGAISINPRAIPPLSNKQWLLLRVTVALTAILALLSYFSRSGTSDSSSILALFPYRLIRTSTPDPFAYVFYATQDSYACSALVNIQIIKKTTRHPIYCFVTDEVSKEYLNRFHRLGVTTILETPPPLSSGLSYYHDVLLKLLAFKMHHYVPHIRRVITMDADQLVLADLDSLFFLPSVTLAAPRAYWIDNGPISSTMMVIELSETTWERVEEGLRTIGHDVYDMDLVQQLFKNDVLMLPGQFASINSHWEAWDIPSWFTGAGHLELLSKSDKTLAETEERLLELFRQSQVMHFFAVGKPWQYKVGDIQKTHPQAHWLLANQFQQWQEKANKACPSDLEHSYIVPKDEEASEEYGGYDGDSGDTDDDLDRDLLYEVGADASKAGQHDSGDFEVTAYDARP